MIFNWDQNNKIVKLGNDEHVLANSYTLETVLRVFAGGGSLELTDGTALIIKKPGTVASVSVNNNTITYNETDYTTKKTYTEEEVVRILSGGGAIELDSGDYLIHYESGGSAPTSAPANATFAEVLTQAEDSKQLFITNYIRDKIAINLLTQVGTTSYAGKYYNTSTTWRNLRSIINAYINPDLSEDLFNYLMDRIGNNYKLIVIYGDRRSSKKHRGAISFEITDLLSAPSIDFFKYGNTRYEVTITFRKNSNDKWEIKYTGKTGTDVNHTLHGVNKYTAIRGLWFEEIT